MQVSRRLAVFCLLIGMATPVTFGSSLMRDHMMQFRWLIGSWESRRKSGLMVEHWRAVDDSSFAGQSVLQRPDGSAQLFEHIELAFRDNAYHYIVTSPSDNGGDRVSFRITSFTDSGFTAENPAHDFPRRIIYRLIRPDSILAIIDAGPGHASESVEFPFSRKKQ